MFHLRPLSGDELRDAVAADQLDDALVEDEVDAVAVELQVFRVDVREPGKIFRGEARVASSFLSA
jgi:hypothetical protein